MKTVLKLAAVTALMLLCLALPRSAVAVELAAGDILVADTVAGVIRVDPVTGAQTVVAPRGGLVISARAIALEADGDILVAGLTPDGSTGAIVRIDPVSGAQTTVSSGGWLYDLSGIVVEPDGSILVSELNAWATLGGVIRVDPVNGAQTIVSQGDWLTEPRGLALKADDRTILVADGQNGLVGVYDGGGQSPRGTIVSPWGVVVAPDGDIVLTNHWGVYRIDGLSHEPTEVSAQGSFISPRGLALEADGSIVVADLGRDQGAPWEPLVPDAIIRVNPVSGAQTTVSSDGSFRRVRGVAVVPTPPDATAPTVTVARPADGASYPRGQSVTADYDCRDEGGGSGIKTCEGDVADGAPIDTGSLGSHTFTVEAVDRAGNRTATAVMYTVADGTAPTVSLAAPSDGASYARGQSVPADYDCRDEAGGSGIETCEGDVANGAPIDTGSLGSHTFTVEAVDRAGNRTATAVMYTVADRTAPTVSIASPRYGANYRLLSGVVVDYACADEARGSGLASCIGTQRDGSWLPTGLFALGRHRFTVTATDNAGNQTTATHVYRVSLLGAG